MAYPIVSRSITHCFAERVNRHRIELLLFPPDNFLDRLLLASAFAIGPVGRQRIEGIANGDNTGAQGNLMSLQIARIAPAAESLMVVKKHHAGFLKALNVAQYHPAEFGVFFDVFELLLSQTSGLQKDM